MPLADRVDVVEQDDDRDEVFSSVRESFANLLNEVEDSLPESREKSLVVSNVEQAFLWARQCVEQNDVP